MANSPKDDTETAPVTIKKYANRRLYNTATSSYVTLDHLAEMVKEGTDFVVYDAKTGEDITRSVLTHIIVEQESRGQNLLPTSFLRHLISFYGDSLQAVVPKYLEHSMQSFAQNQGNMREYLQETFGNMAPFTTFEEMSRQNMAFFESAMKMFNPMGVAAANANAAKAKSASGASPGTPPGSSDDAVSAGSPKESDIEMLRSQLFEMQKRLDRLGDK